MNKIFDTITLMRFPIILLVITLHGYTVTRGLISGVGSDLYHKLTYYPSLILGEMGVPIFFTISGFLFFYKLNFDNLYSYKKKIKSRIKTLFIPYLLWNLFMLIFLIILQKMPWTTAFFTGNNESVTNYDIKDFICSFWNTGSGFPILPTLWYIRNLMVLSLCSPLIYILCKKLRIIYLLLVGGLCLCGSTMVFTFSSIFYFSLGGYLMIQHVDVISFVKKYSRVIIVFFIISSLIVVYMYFFLNNGIINYIQKILLLQGVVFFFTISFLLVEKNIRIPQILSKSTFFVYAIHFPIIAGIGRILLKFLNDGEFKFLICYFLSILLTIFISLLVYVAIQKISPGFLRVITGNRN